MGLKNFEDKIQLYSSLLLQYTKTHNITALKTKEDIIANIEDSIFPLRYLDFEYKSIADIGSGAGFPGLFLALKNPHVKVTLYEPLSKKSAFLNLAKVKLGLKNLHVKSIRVENEKDALYDLIVSRAVTKTKILLDLSKNISDKNTSFLLYKGSSVDEELDTNLNYQIHKKANRHYVLIKGISC